MKILITGAAGFIGSHLCRALLAEGHVVIGIDNLSRGLISNIASFSDNKNFSFVFGNVHDKSVSGNIKADIIVHLASKKIPRYSDGLQNLGEGNLMLNVLVEKCVRDNSKLIFASTSDVYGKNPLLPFNEESDLVIGPTTVRRWAYAVSKIHAEHYIIASSEVSDFNWTILRFFGTYGPNHDLSWQGGPQSVFIEKALKKEAIEIHGSGLQTRTFTYVDDTVNAIVRCINDERSNGEIFNTGSDPAEEIAIIDLAKMVWKMVNGDASEALIKYIPYSDFGRYEDVMRRVPDISKLKRFFGFKSAWSLEAGLLKTIAWQRELSASK